MGFQIEGDSDTEIVKAVRLNLEDSEGNWRTAISFAFLDADYISADGETTNGINVEDGKIKIKQVQLSAEYNWEDWQLIGEYSQRDIGRYGIVGGMPFVQEGEGLYLQLGYRLDDDWTLYVRRDETYLDKNDRSGRELSRQGIPANFAFAKDNTIGIRFQPSFHWTFGAEFHAIDGQLWLPNIENPDLPNDRTHWNLFVLEAAYRF